VLDLSESRLVASTVAMGEVDSWPTGPVAPLREEVTSVLPVASSSQMKFGGSASLIVIGMLAQLQSQWSPTFWTSFPRRGWKKSRGEVKRTQLHE
jgi:hypothetical protein